MLWGGPEDITLETPRPSAGSCKEDVKPRDKGIGTGLSHPIPDEELEEEEEVRLMPPARRRHCRSGREEGARKGISSQRRGRSEHGSGGRQQTRAGQLNYGVTGTDRGVFCLQNGQRQGDVQI